MVEHLNRDRLTMNEIPRRIRINLLTPIEIKARQLMLDIEALGCHVMLTNAANVVFVLREKLADWVDAGSPGVTQPTAPLLDRIVPRYLNGEDLQD